MFPAVGLKALAGGLAVGLAFLAFLCGAGAMLATAVRPGMVRAILFVWLGVASSAPQLTALVLSQRAGREVAPPWWTLPVLSPASALASWADSVDTATRSMPQYGSLHERSVLAYGGLGALFWLWGRRRIARKEVRA